MTSIELREAGFGDDEIRGYLSGKHADLRAAGFSDVEIEAQYGPNPAAPPNPPPFDWEKSFNEIAVKDASEVIVGPGQDARTVRNDFGEAIHDTFVQPWINIGYTAGESFNRGSAHFAQNCDTIARYYEDKYGMKRGGFFESAASEFNKNADYWKKRADEVGVTFLQELVGSATGGAIPGIEEFMLNVPYAGILGAAEAHKTGENEWGKSIVAMAKRGTLGAVFHAMGPLNQYLRSPSMGAVFGIQAATEGGGPREIAMAFGTGAGYSLTSPGGRYGLNELTENVKAGLRKTEKQVERARETVEEAEKPKEKENEIPEPQVPQVTAEPDLSPTDETSVLTDTSRFPVQRINVADVKAIPEKLQFKLEVDEAGVQKPLTGEFNELAAGNLILWQSKEGEIFVANGHHRLELAKRQGIEQLNAQILKEKDGFSTEDARRVAAEANILEGKGTIYDHAEYFRFNKDYDTETVKSKGLAGEGYAIGRFATDNTYAQFRNHKISPDATEAISTAAPADESLQLAGVKYALANPKADYHDISNLVKALKIEERGPVPEQGDMFGFDDSAINRAEAMSKAVTAIMRDLREDLNAVLGASKRPERAKKLGVNVEDPEAVRVKINELRNQIAEWERWFTNPELVKRAQEVAGIEEAQAPRAVAAARAIDIPEGWSTRIQPDWRRTPGWRAEVDWKNKAIVFETKGDANDIGIINHEVGHIRIEDLLGDITKLSDSPFLKEYAKVTNTTQNHINDIREHAAISYGEYLTDPSKVSPQVKAIFDKHFLQPEAVAARVGEEPSQFAMVEDRVRKAQIRSELQGELDFVGSNTEAIKGDLGPAEKRGADIKLELRKTGRIDIRGQQAKNAADLAVLCQIFRDRRYETLRVIYMKGDEVVGHEAVSSRMPGFSNYINMGKVNKQIEAEGLKGTVAEARFRELAEQESDRFYYGIHDRVGRLGADGFWLLHNHPSGEPMPSVADLRFTEQFKEGPRKLRGPSGTIALKGFKGHVVIDSGKYAWISDNGSFMGVESLPGIPEGWKDPVLAPLQDHPLIGKKLNTTSLVAGAAAELARRPGFVTIAYVDSKLKVLYVEEITEKHFNNVKGSTEFVRGRAKALGSTSQYAYAENVIGASFDAAKTHLNNGTFLDVMFLSPTPYISTHTEMSASGWKYDYNQFFGKKAHKYPAVRTGEEKEPYEVKTEKTEAGEQAVMPGISQAETFGLRPGETQWGELEPSAPGAKGREQGALFATERRGRRPTPEDRLASEGPVSRSEIVDLLQNKLLVPIRTGRFREPALGIYKMHEQVIRSKQANDIDVISHETGHHIQRLLWPQAITAKGLSSMPFTQFKGELDKIATRPRAGQEATPEGFAEFIKLYITDPGQAQSRAPNFYTFFEGQLDAKAPEIKGILLEARKKYDLYTKQPALQRVVSQISIGDKDNSPVTMSDLYTKCVDDLHPLELAVNEMAKGDRLIPQQDPYKLARLMRGWVGKAEAFIKNKPFRFADFKDVEGSKGLKEILKPVEDHLDEFRAYAVSKRALELHQRGITSGLEAADARAVVAQYDEQFNRAFEELKQYQDHTLQYLHDAGLIDTVSLAKMKILNQNYVPFYRVMEDTKGQGVGKGLQSRQPIKRIRGSGRDIVDPIESIIKNTFLYINLAEKNAVGKALVDLAHTNEGFGKFIERIPTPLQKIKVNVSEGPMAKEMGQIHAEMKIMADQLGIETVELGGMADTFDIFRASAFAPRGDVIAVWSKGKRSYYQLSPDLARVFQGLDRENANMIIKILSYPASWLRAGATLTPEFVGRNPIRDQFTAFVYSKYGFIPGVDLVRGIFSMVKKDDLYWAWKKAGADHSMLVSMDRDYIQDNLADVLQKYPVKNLIKNPINALRILSELGEQGTRIGEFKKGIAKEGMTKAGMQEAGFSSREVTLDFNRIGSKTKAVNQIIAFWNANIQGSDRMYRAFRDNPLGTTARVAAAITLPSVLLAIANHDDERYKEIPQWQKDLFWIIPTDHCIYRIPKPFELGILFGSVPERITHFIMDQDPHSFDGIFDSIGRGLSPGVIPTVGIPLLENWANKSFFFDRPIVPRSREDLLPEYQYSDYTTETAKKIGQIIGKFPGIGTTGAASPAYIENLVQGWTGGLGRYALQIAEAGLKASGAVEAGPEKPSKTLADIPFVKAFVVRFPSAQAESIERFYQNYSKASAVNKTIKALMEKEQNPEIALKLWQESGMADLEGVRSGLGNMRDVIDLVYRNPDMTGDEKRQIIDTVYMQMIMIAKQGNTIYDEYEKVRREVQEETKRGIGPARSEARIPASRERPAPREAPAPVF